MASFCGLFFDIQITGDCTNNGSGAFSLTITGSAPDYTVQFLGPTTDVYYLGPGVTATTFTSLSAGTYVFEIIDTCLTAGTPTIGSLNISNGTTVSCIDIENTSNFLENGSITAQTTNFYSLSSFYLYDFYSGFITSGQSATDRFTFSNLSASTYYVIADDGGGCTGQSETVIIQSSTTFDYGFYVVSDTACRGDNGKLFITGLTGQQPYTYLWSNGETTPSISGLSATGYTVTVTDKTGAQVTKGVAVPSTPSLGLISVLPTFTSCYTDDGEIIITISGGTPPYNYILSNGDSHITNLDFQYFFNLSAGNYKITVIDASYCTFNTEIDILTPSGFNVLSMKTQDSFCDTASGLVSVSLIGGKPNYTYSLSGENGINLLQVTNRTSHIFSNLFPGNYNLRISDFGVCVYNELITINSTSSFDVTVVSQDATFRGDDGSVTISVSSGSSPYTYKVSGQPPITKSDNTTTFRNLKTGSYLASITDNNGCTVSESFFIEQTEPTDFLVFVPPTERGKKGSIEVYVTKGTPPFQVKWSENVGSQTGLTVTDLSGGSYSVSVTDGNGSTQTRNVEVTYVELISSYLIYNVCDSNINNVGTVVKKGLSEMLTEGYLNLTQDDVNCIMNSAVFNTIVEVDGNTYQSPFYTSLSLNDFPFDNDFYSATETILLGIPGIDSVEFDSITNQVRINTGCSDQTVSLIDQPITISVQIQYDISCENCGGAGSSPSVGLDFSLVASDNGNFGFDEEGRYMYLLPETQEYVASLGITRNETNTKVWALDITGTLIYEYDIVSLIPYQLSFNRQITLSTTLSRALCWYDSSTLLSCIDGTYELSNVDILTGNVSPGINLSTVPFTVVSKTILVNSIDKILVILTDVSGDHTLVQYDSLGNSEVKITLPFSNSGYTMFEDGSNFYVVDIGTLYVYSVESTYPYTITYSYTLETPQSVSYFYMTQIKTYVTTNFTIPAPSPTPTNTPTPTETPTNTPTPTITPTVTPTENLFVTPTPSITPTITPSPYSLTSFVSIWSGSSVTLPYDAAGTYSGTIYWGDGATSGNSFANRSHTYSSAGTYTIVIDGDITGFKFASAGDRLKLREITRWGTLRGLSNSNERMFEGCNNLVLTGLTGTLNTSGITSFWRMFWSCSSLTTVPNMGNWDTTSVTDMSFTFLNATGFNENIGTWVTSAVTDMQYMFNNNYLFNQNINSWDVSNVINMEAMFAGMQTFDQPLSGWVTSSVIDMDSTFAQMDVFNQDISNWDVSSVVSMNSMFVNSSLFNQDLGGWDVSNVTGMTNMLNGTNIDTVNYDNLLVGWDSLPSLISGVTIGVGGLQYTSAGAGGTARTNIINNYGWTFNGDSGV